MQNVIDKLKTIEGFDLDKFIGFLQQGGDFYNGEQSNVARQDYSVPGSGYTVSMAQDFRNNPGEQAVTNGNPAFSRFTVFFRPNYIDRGQGRSAVSGLKISGLNTHNLVFAFHEAIHGYGTSVVGNLKPFSDDALKRLFDLHPTNSGDTSIISDYIQEHCF